MSWEESLKRIEKKIYEVTIKADEVQGNSSSVILIHGGANVNEFWATRDPFISVIVCTYNMENFIKKFVSAIKDIFTMRSLEKQSLFSVKYELSL